MLSAMTQMADSGRARPSFASGGRRAELRRAALFLAVGGLGLAADAAIFSALQGLDASRPAARAASLACATIVTFALNRRYTFAATARRGGGDLARYAAVTLLAQGFSYALFLALSAAAPALPALAALVAAAAAATLLSFTGQRFFTFRGA